MRSKPPAVPAELKAQAIVYRRIVTGTRGDHGQQIYEYQFRQRTRFKPVRQKVSDQNAAHHLMAVFASALVTNWWEANKIAKDDIIVFGDRKLHCGLRGIPMNWEERNRWGIIEIVGVDICPVGATCVCADLDPTVSAPEGTA